MSREHKDMPVPGLQELFRQLLGERIQAAAGGFLGERLLEVVPYQGLPPLAIDAGLAWAEALEAARAFELPTNSLECPSGWAELVADAAPTACVPMCLGNFPQMVRDVKALAEIANLPSLRPQPRSAPVADSGVRSWRSSDTSLPVRLARAGLLRLCGDYAEAKQVLAEMPKARGELKSALLNERAALAWHQGDHETADGLWKQAKEEIPILFNRGLAMLFCGEAAQSKPLFDRVLGDLPASSGWRQLAELYLAVIELKA
jgi:tetratricopeptide (TPR) repeat protein